MVPEQEGEVEENGEVLGKEHDNGGVRALRCDGQAFATVAGDDPEERQRERVRRSLAAR